MCESGLLRPKAESEAFAFLARKMAEGLPDPTKQPTLQEPAATEDALAAIALVRSMSAFPKIVGFDIVEVQPAYDVGSVTSILAALLTFEFLSARAINAKNAG